MQGVSHYDFVKYCTKRIHNKMVYCKESTTFNLEEYMKQLLIIASILSLGLASWAQKDSTSHAESSENGRSPGRGPLPMLLMPDPNKNVLVIIPTNQISRRL